MSDVNGSADLLFVNGPVYTVDAATELGDRRSP